MISGEDMAILGLWMHSRAEEPPLGSTRVPELKFHVAPISSRGRTERKRRKWIFLVGKTRKPLGRGSSSDITGSLAVVWLLINVS
jgi:hypothetical protein